MATCQRRQRITSEQTHASGQSWSPSIIVGGFDAGKALYRQLYEDYEKRASLEAQLVKAADVIDLLVQVLALERGGARGLDEFWEVANEGNFELQGIAQEVVKEVLQSLLAAHAEID